MSRVVDTGVIPECYVDTNLTETLTGIICNHQKGCANVVLNKIQKGSSFFPPVPCAQGSVKMLQSVVEYLREHTFDAEEEKIKEFVV